LELPIDKAFLDSLIDTEMLYEHAPCGYFSFTPKGLIIKINQTLLQWLDYERDEVTYRINFTDLISRGGKIYYEMFYFPLLQLQSAVNEINFDFIRKDGSRFPALINSKVIRSESGKLLAVNATVYNITDRKKYEQELLDAKKTADDERSRFESLSDFIPEMVWTAGPDGRLNYVNKRFRNFFNLDADKTDLPAVIARVHRKDRHSLMKNWIKTVRSEVVFKSQIRFQDAVGVFQWYMVRAVALLDEEGNVSKWMGSCTDINEHVTAIEKLDEFISVASHELKTPITTLKASLQLMNKFKDTDAALKILPKLIEQSNRSAGKISSLVADLLNTGNLKEGQMQLQKTRFKVLQLLKDSCPHVSSDGSYELDVNAAPGLEVVADEHRIDQILVNFVNNAIKYAPNSKKIFLAAEPTEDDAVKISVRDTGPGIAAEKLPYVFERYYRIDNSGLNYSGLGLGLYICAEIVRKHGGTIGVDSKPGVGTTFWFTLPLA
jgi:PAS domain S-box-containing protein